MVHGRDPFPAPLGGSEPVAHPHRSALDGRSQWLRPSHELVDGKLWVFKLSVMPGGAAGSRTRVPRSRRSGLYVRRFRMSSDVGLRSQAASTSTPPFNVPLGPAVIAFGVEPRDDDSTLLRGIGGESSQVIRLRVPGRYDPQQSWHLWFPAWDYRGRASTLGTLPWRRTDHGRNHVSPKSLVRRIGAVKFSIRPEKSRSAVLSGSTNVSDRTRFR